MLLWIGLYFTMNILLWLIVQAVEIQGNNKNRLISNKISKKQTSLNQYLTRKGYFKSNKFIKIFFCYYFFGIPMLVYSILGGKKA